MRWPSLRRVRDEERAAGIVVRVAVVSRSSVVVGKHWTIQCVCMGEAIVNVIYCVLHAVAMSSAFVPYICDCARPRDHKKPDIFKQEIG